MRRIIVPVLLAGLFYSCTSVPAGNSNTDSSVLYLSDSLLNIVSVDTVKLLPVENRLFLNGRVDFDQKYLADVFLKWGGRVAAVNVELGDFVRKGDVLAVIRSSEVAEVEKQQKEAELQLELSQRSLQTLEDMASTGMTSQKDLLQGRQQLVAAQGELTRLNELFAIYSVSGESSYQIKSPVSGFVVEKNINREMQLQSDMDEKIFSISGLENVWIMADVYETDISRVSEGAEVDITTLAYPDKVFKGKIDKVYHILDEQSKTMHVRVSLHNADYLLKPGMFATVSVACSSDNEMMACVDSRALVFDGGCNYLVTLNEDNRLTVSAVSLYRNSGADSFLASGVLPGRRFVSRNALLIYNAIKAD